jgi:ribosomal protein S18 acetylase RimI-like enzyme
LRLLAPGVAELKRIWTRPSHRGRGVARAVTEALVAAARAVVARCLDRVLTASIRSLVRRVNGRPCLPP